MYLFHRKGTMRPFWLFFVFFLFSLFLPLFFVSLQYEKMEIIQITDNTDVFLRRLAYRTRGTREISLYLSVRSVYV